MKKKPTRTKFMAWLGKLCTECENFDKEITLCLQCPIRVSYKAVTKMKGGELYV